MFWKMLFAKPKSNYAVIQFVTWKHYNAWQLPMFVLSLVNTDRDSYAHKFIIYALLESFQLCPIMLLVYPYYAHAVN